MDICCFHVATKRTLLTSYCTLLTSYWLFSEYQMDLVFRTTPAPVAVAISAFICRL